MNKARRSDFDFSTWLTGYSGLPLYCAVVSVFGLTGYYSDLLREYVPDWLGVGILMSPLLIIIFVQWDELPDRVVFWSHISAASLFMLASIGMEIGSHVFGYEPEGFVLFRVLAHAGWTFAWGDILRGAWRRK